MNESRAEFSVMSVPKDEHGTPVEEFARILANMNRLLSRVSSVPPFKHTDLGVSEWIALVVLRQQPGINNNQLAVKLAVTRQRAHQLVNKLESAKLISIEISSRDSRENILLLTKSGQKQLETMNAKVSSLLEAALGPQAENLWKLRKQLLMLQRAIRDVSLDVVKNSSDAKGAQTAAAARAKRGSGFEGLGQASPNREA